MERHTLEVMLRAGGATLAAGLAAHLIAPPLAAPIAIAAGAAVLAFELDRVRRTVLRRLDEIGADLAQTQPLLDLARILPTRRPLPPMTGYAIAPDFALLLAELIAREEPRVVVETGSGVSTLVIGYALERLGRGKVVALEHDPAYAQATRALIAEHGLEAYATVVDAPLAAVELGGRAYRWYARDALAALGEIDLVVDDGPPRHVGDMLRYASLPVLAKQLRRTGTFVLDVVGDEERRVLARWRAELPEFEHTHVPSKKGNVLIRYPTS